MPLKQSEVEAEVAGLFYCTKLNMLINNPPVVTVQYGIFDRGHQVIFRSPAETLEWILNEKYEPQ